MGIKRILSIDVGIKNFGYFVCTYDSNKITPEYFDNMNLTPYSCKKLSDVLDGILKYEITDVLIEKQLSCNKHTTRVMNHLEMYFAAKHPVINVLMISPKKKGLASEPKYSIRKKNAVEKCRNFLIDTENKDLLKKLETYKKKDDISDAVCQVLEFYK